MLMGYTEAAAEPDGMKEEAEAEQPKIEEAVEPVQAPNGVSEDAEIKVEAAPAPEEAPKTYEEQLGQLDLQLIYLWRVHGVDYYAGLENAEPDSYDACAGSRRILRCTRPEEGEQPVKEEGEALARSICICFTK